MGEVRGVEMAQKSKYFSDVCPFCGAEGELLADATANASGITLSADGFDINEGKPVGGEIYNIDCGACGKNVPADHYYLHADSGGEECDCTLVEPDECEGCGLNKAICTCQPVNDQG